MQLFVGANGECVNLLPPFTSVRAGGGGTIPTETSVGELKQTRTCCAHCCEARAREAPRRGRPPMRRRSDRGAAARAARRDRPARPARPPTPVASPCARASLSYIVLLYYYCITVVLVLYYCIIILSCCCITTLIVLLYYCLIIVILLYDCIIVILPYDCIIVVLLYY